MTDLYKKIMIIVFLSIFMYCSAPADAAGSDALAKDAASDVPAESSPLDADAEIKEIKEEIDKIEEEISIKRDWILKEFKDNDEKIMEMLKESTSNE